MQSFFDALIPEVGDIKLAAESSELLSANIKDGSPVQLILKEDPSKVLTLPSSAVHFLLEMLEQISKGKSLAVFPLEAKLTTQQAADMLSVSRPFLVKELEKGRLPFYKVGAHRRILLKDLLDYKNKMLNSRETALEELAKISQDLNLGYDE